MAGSQPATASQRRHWESMGLLAPARVTAGRRRYGEGDLYRVAAIPRAKQAGFSLDEIWEVTAKADPTARGPPSCATVARTSLAASRSGACRWK